MKKILLTTAVILSFAACVQSCGTTEPTECNPNGALVRCKGVSPIGSECTNVTFNTNCQCNKHSWIK